MPRFDDAGIYTKAASSTDAYLSQAPPGLVGTLGFQIIDSDGTVVAPRTTAGIVELIAGSGEYRARFISPAAHGEYRIEWDTAGATPRFGGEALHVGVLPTPADDSLPGWAPTVQDIADLSPAYTRGLIDDPGQQAGAQQYGFDESTNPTADQVSALIEVAVREVTGRTARSAAALDAWADLARVTAAWHVAASIEAEKAPEGADETNGAYGWKQASYVANLTALIRRAGTPRLGSLRMRSPEVETLNASTPAS
jgi:hypothetical protein